MMTIIDPTTAVGRLRLSVSDFSDLPMLPDVVYTQTLIDKGNNENLARQVIAGYILGILSQRGHSKLQYIEIHGNQVFDQYLKFIKEILRNPYSSGTSPIPYSNVITDACGNTVKNPIVQFQEDYKATQTPLSESDDLHRMAQVGVI